MKKIIILMIAVVMLLTVPTIALAASRTYSGSCSNFVYSDPLPVDYPGDTHLEDDNTYCRLGSTTGTDTDYSSEIYLDSDFLGGYYYLDSGDNWYCSFFEDGDFKIKFSDPHSTKIYFYGVQKSW
jgi:hypothetical protein